MRGGRVDRGFLRLIHDWELDGFAELSSYKGEDEVGEVHDCRWNLARESKVRLFVMAKSNNRR